MTVDDLVQKLINMPQDVIITYRHNQYGRIDVDTVEFEQELMYSGGYIRIVTLSGKAEEDNNVIY